MFVFGFKAVPTSYTCIQICNDMFLYVFHGVFEADFLINTDVDDEDNYKVKKKRIIEVMSFDRSFTVGFIEDTFYITNDNLVIRMFKQ